MTNSDNGAPSPSFPPLPSSSTATSSAFSLRSSPPSAPQLVAQGLLFSRQPFNSSFNHSTSNPSHYHYPNPNPNSPSTSTSTSAAQSSNSYPQHLTSYPQSQSQIQKAAGTGTKRKASNQSINQPSPERTAASSASNSVPPEKKVSCLECRTSKVSSNFGSERNQAIRRRKL